MNLLWEIENYLRQTDTSPTRFGKTAVGDPRFVFDLRKGREPRESTVARVLTFLESPL